MDTNPNPPVPVNEAIEMTANWRSYYAQITGTDPENALRAFKIPLEDLQAMVDLAQKDTQITSVRAYLALGEPANDTIVDSDKIHVLLVPVSNTSEAGTDLLEIQVAGRTISTIMDFTTPCPALCDQASPLYGPVHH